MQIILAQNLIVTNLVSFGDVDTWLSCSSYTHAWQCCLINHTDTFTFTEDKIIGLLQHCHVMRLATGWTTRGGGRNSSPGGGKNFHFSMLSRQALGPIQPPIQWVPRSLSPGVKRSGREADHSPPTSAEVKKTWVYTPTPLYVFMA
jgi:hypothetical protein